MVYHIYSFSISKYSYANCPILSTAGVDPNLTASAYLITKSCQLFVKISEEIFLLKKGAAGLMGEERACFSTCPRRSIHPSN